MRCHDGKHRSGDGAVIPNSCRTCHIIFSQGSQERSAVIDLQRGLQFQHPVEIGMPGGEEPATICHMGKRVPDSLQMLSSRPENNSSYSSRILVR
jgi:hypothetical protein